MKCQHCRSEFKPSRKGHRYCSQKCNIADWTANNPRNRKGKKFAYECLHCGKECVATDSRKKYCSKACHYKYHNSQRPNSKLEWRRCPQCEELFQPGQNRGVGKTYCSPECRLKANRTGFNSAKPSRRWKGNWQKAIKRDGRKCQMCQHDFAAPKQAGDPRMEVHHLDGEGEAQSKNHDLDNLMTLCSRCHRQFHQIFLVKEDGEWKVQGKMLQMLGIKSISTTV